MSKSALTPRAAAKKWFLGLRLSTRIGLAAIAVAALVAIIFGSAIAPPTDVDTSAASNVRATHSASPSPTPSPTPTVATPKFTDDDPGDPTITVAADGSAAVAIASTDGTKMTTVALLATLPIKGRAPMTGYVRTAQFGAAWLDVDHNGCDTRNDILARDLTSITRSGPCRVMTGELADPYVDQTISFVRGNTTSAFVQIDHVVALGDAWQTGAQQLTQAQRISLANDPLNLLAVDAHSNLQKSDGDAATWLPAKKSFRCDYVTRQVSVKATYGLWVTQAEHDAMARVLDSCADAQAMTSTFTPAPVVVAAPVAPAAVSPGAFCPDALVGQSGVAANGKTYVCGGKGADAHGHYRWNA
ncbi:HNH endonuclease family protein [Lacisediminihabitans changchengi]|uniref:HNH endonuclease family protein n=1 Tax=Lacisediminihabitans changchengi TaxID=2787634 RepID=UPI0027DD4B50|nr:HNH endonuclease family protein [Lacisediminihabitans changchengi]